MNDAQSPPKPEGIGSGLGLMVVDDDAGVRNMLDEWLRHQGFAVWQAATGEEAIEIYRRRPEAFESSSWTCACPTSTAHRRWPN